MASNFLASSAGMMPSQSWVTISHVDFHFRAKRVGDVDVKAFDLAVCGDIVERRICAFCADDQLVMQPVRRRRRMPAQRLTGRG